MLYELYVTAAPGPIASALGPEIILTYANPQIKQKYTAGVAPILQ